MYYYIYGVNMNQDNLNELKTEILVNEEDIIKTSPQSVEISTGSMKITPATIVLVVVAIFSLTMMFYNNYNSNKGQIEYLTTIASGEVPISEEEKLIIQEKKEEKEQFIKSVGVINESLNQLESYSSIDNSAVLYQKFETKADAVKALARTQYHTTKFSDLFLAIQENLLVLAAFDSSYISDGMKREIVKSIVEYSQAHESYYLDIADKMGFIIQNYDLIDFSDSNNSRKFSDSRLENEWESKKLEFLSISARMRALNMEVKDNIKNAALSNT